MSELGGKRLSFQDRFLTLWVVMGIFFASFYLSMKTGANYEQSATLSFTAEPFFKRRGYHRTDREKAPPAIRKTKEFDEICPSNSAFMVKVL